MERGQPVIAAHVGNELGAWVVGSAQPTTLMRKGPPGPQRIRLGRRRTVTVTPARADLKTPADGILGVDVWRQGGTLTVDYARRMVVMGPGTDFKGLDAESFRGLPAIQVTLDGKLMVAIVDTSFPGGVLAPRSQEADHPTHATVGVNGVRVRARVDYADVPQARIGNEILREFVVMIDYGHGKVALWHDPR